MKTIEVGGNTEYNTDTDSLDVYSEGELVGSIYCGFQKYIMYNSGITPTGVSIINNGTGITLAESYIQLKGGYSYGRAANGVVVFNKLMKVDGKTKISINCDISTVGYQGRIYIELNVNDSISNVFDLTYSKCFSSYDTSLTTGSKTLEMDISTVTGEYYVCIGVVASIYNNDAIVAKITKVVIE